MADIPPTNPYSFTDNSAPSSPRKRFAFDPTINLGHVLTAAVTLAGAFSAGLAAWGSIDKRIVSLELEQRYSKERQEQRDLHQDQQLRETVIVIKEAIQRIERNIDRETEKGRTK